MRTVKELEKLLEDHKHSQQVYQGIADTFSKLVKEIKKELTEAKAAAEQTFIDGDVFEDKHGDLYMLCQTGNNVFQFIGVTDLGARRGAGNRYCDTKYTGVPRFDKHGITKEQVIPGFIYVGPFRENFKRITE